MRTSMRLGLALAVLLGVASVATAGDDSDEILRERVEKKLTDKDVANGSGPFVEVHDGVATLSGTVKSLWAKQKAIELAMKVEEVHAVEDELEIAFAESDSELGENISKAVNRYPFFTVYDDVNLSVDDGNVTLIGRVTMPYKSEEIAKRVSKVMGVQSLTNTIKTLPTNIGDQRLRANLTRRIYGNSMFIDLASRRNPPIHIVVENGRVALTGAVRTKVERVQAEHIARSTFGVFNVENHLRVGD